MRIEIEAALSRDVPVIPVLVDGAAPPQAADLPESLKKLARRQAIEISHNRFDSDAERLTEALARIEEEARGEPRRPAEDAPGKTEVAPARTGGAASPARSATRAALPPLVLAVAGLVVLLALGTGMLMRGRPPQSTSPSADLAQPRAPAAARPSPSRADGPAASPANSEVIDPSVLTGPSSNLIVGAPDAAAGAVPPKESLAGEIEQQKVAAANAAQDIDRLSRGASAAVQGIKMDSAPPAPSKFANAAAPAPNSAVQGSSAHYHMTDCGSIADTRIGVEWYIGPDKDVPWQDAANWARGLAACGKRWSLPSVDEVCALFDRDSTAGVGYASGGRKWPAHIDPIFSAIGGGSWVWTKGTPANGNAPAFNLNQGVPVQISATRFEGSVRAFAIAR